MAARKLGDPKHFLRISQGYFRQASYNHEFF